MTTRQLDSHYRRLSDIQRQMTENRAFIGGIRIECGFRATRFESAINKFLQHRPHRRTPPSCLRGHTFNDGSYLLQARQTWRCISTTTQHNSSHSTTKANDGWPENDLRIQSHGGCCLRLELQPLLSVLANYLKIAILAPFWHTCKSSTKKQMGCFSRNPNKTHTKR